MLANGTRDVALRRPKDSSGGDNFGSKSIAATATNPSIVGSVEPVPVSYPLRDRIGKLP